MNSSDIIVGLDIGTTKICTVIGECNDHGLIEIIGVGVTPSRGLRRGVVINIESTVKSILSAVENAEMMSGREVQGVFAGLAGGTIEGINSRGVVAVTGRGREITREDIDRVIDAARAIVVPMEREVLHVIPQEFIVDDQGGIRNPMGMIGVRLECEVHIITGLVTSSQNIVRSINRAGFKVEDIVLEPLASARAVLTKDEKELGVLMIDLGGGTTDVLVYIEGAPYHTEVIPLGSEQVTNDISIMLKTPIETAEKIKLQYGCCYMDVLDGDEEIIIPGVGGRPARRILKQNLAEIIQPRVSEILRIAREQIEQKGYLKLLGGGVVVTGGGALMPGLAELATDIFGLPARIGYPVKLGGLVEEYYDPRFATAVGLILHGADQDADGETARVKTRKGSIKNAFERVKDWFKEFL